MELKEAIALAKHHIKDVFAEEQIDELGLEEVEFDDATQNWMITIGFSRPWGTERVAGIPPRMFPSKRDYKVVSDNNKKVLSIKNREPAAE